MSKERLAIDIDDVLANSNDAVRLFVNQVRGVDLNEEHYLIEAEYWGFYEKVWEQHGIDPIDLLSDFHQTQITDQSDIRPIEGAVEGTKRLSTRYDLIPMTSRPVEMEEETKRWLDMNFALIFARTPIFVGFGPNAKRTKGQICAEMGITYLIDDNVEHCKPALAHNIGAILFGNYGWHQRIPKEVIRCKTWPEVLEYFENEKS
jgi:5'(3')-deoxyribonucleotidase